MSRATSNVYYWSPTPLILSVNPWPVKDFERLQRNSLLTRQMMLQSVTGGVEVVSVGILSPALNGASRFAQA